MASTVKKISLAIGKKELAWAERRARREKTSVSAVLTAAARRAQDEERERARQDKVLEQLVDWATNGRGFSADEIDQARRELDEA